MVCRGSIEGPLVGLGLVADSLGTDLVGLGLVAASLGTDFVTFWGDAGRALVGEGAR